MLKISPNLDLPIVIASRPDLVIAPDFDGEPTVWMPSPDGSKLMAALQRSDITPACRESLWAFLEQVITKRGDDDA